MSILILFLYFLKKSLYLSYCPHRKPYPSQFLAHPLIHKAIASILTLYTYPTLKQSQGI